jgi:branched-chain amino acid transport system substrate-binding protein
MRWKQFMRPMTTTLFSLVVASTLAMSANAEEGVTSDSILIGQSAGLTGNLAERVKPAVAAANLYFDEVNRKGGVNGRRIKLLSIDDGGEVPRSVENTKRLIDQDHVFALLLQTGAGPAAASMPIAVKAHVPFIAPLTGTTALREPNRYVFHVKASFADEWQRIAEHMKSLNLSNIAIVYFDNDAGREGMKIAQESLAKVDLKPALVVGFGGKAGTMKDAVDKTVKAESGAIILSSVQQPAAEYLNALFATGKHPFVYTNSISIGEAIYKAAGDKAHGVIISQTVPYPNEIGLPLVREYQELAKRANVPPGGYPAIEGFISAKVMVEGLRRTGKNLTRENFIDALEGIKSLDVGGYVLRFSPTDHVGSRVVDLTMVARGGRFVR